MRLKIGVFAKMGGVSVRMLRHYDTLNLLKPAYTDAETGFRYYDADQLTDLHNIRDLQSLGFTLKEIRTLQFIDTVDDIHAQLWQQKQKLLSEIREQHRQINELQYRLNVIEDQCQPLSYPFLVKPLPSETIIHARSLLHAEDDIVNGFQRILASMTMYNISVQKTLGIKHYAYQDSSDFEWAFQLSDMNFQRLSINSEWELRRRKLGGAVVASTLMRGSFMQSLPSQNGFHAWANFHHYELAGATREIYIRIIDNDIHHPDNLMEVQFPIQRR